MTSAETATRPAAGGHGRGPAGNPKSAAKEQQEDRHHREEGRRDNDLRALQGDGQRAAARDVRTDPPWP